MTDDLLVPLDEAIPADGEQVRLPGGVTEAALRAAVADNHSWRGVLRQFGMTAPRNARRMRAVCDAHGISYEHFSGTRWEKVPGDALVAAVEESKTWLEVMSRLGFADDSGSARASLRRAAVALGLDLGHLSDEPQTDAGDAFAGIGEIKNLRYAATFVVAAKCTMLGHRVAWPLEPQPYDLLVDTDQHGILRVQVKSGTRLAGNSWVAAITKSRRGPSGAQERMAYTADEVDYFAVVDPELQVYMLPIGLVEGQTAVSLRKYDTYRMAV